MLTTLGLIAMQGGCSGMTRLNIDGGSGHFWLRNGLPLVLSVFAR